MKILNLKIENIASLKGHHEINFSKLLESDDLFAITGPTGSGKSSILTSISLALFNTHHKKLRPIDIITQGTQRGQVELLFEVSGKEYLSKWSCNIRKKNGELRKVILPAQTELIHNGVTLEKSPQEIIKLTFEQFSKTVVLNQGEFARFLTSSFSDRKDILEKLWGGGEIANLGTLARQDIKILESEMKIMAVKKESSLPFTVEEIDFQRKVLKENQQIFINLENYLNILNKLQQSLKQTLDLIEKKELNNTRKLAYAERLEKTTLEYNQLKIELKAHEAQQISLVEFNKLRIPNLNKAIALQKEIDLLQKENLSAKDSIVHAEEQHLAFEKKLNELLEDSKKILNENTKLSEIIKSNLNKDTIEKIEHEFKELGNLQTNNDLHTQHIEQLSLQQNTIKKNAVELKESAAKLEKTFLNEYGASTPFEKIAALEKMESLLNEKKSKQSQLITILSTKKDQANALETELNDIKLKQSKISNDISSNQALLESTFLQLELLQKDFEINKLKAAVSLCTHESQKSGECIVCKSEYRPQHPTGKARPESLNSSLQAKIESLDANAKELEHTLLKARERDSYLNEQRDTKKQELLAYQKEITNIESIENELDEISEKLKEVKSDIIITTKNIEKSKLNNIELEKSRQSYTELSNQKEKIKQAVIDNQKLGEISWQKLEKLSPKIKSSCNDAEEEFQNEKKAWFEYDKNITKMTGVNAQVKLTTDAIANEKLTLKSLSEKKDARELDIKDKTSIAKGIIDDLCPNLELEKLTLEQEKSYKKHKVMSDSCRKVERAKDSLDNSIQSMCEQTSDIEILASSTIAQNIKLINNLTQCSYAKENYSKYDYISAISKVESLENEAHYFNSKREISHVVEEIGPPHLSEIASTVEELRETNISSKTRVDEFDRKMKESFEITKNLDSLNSKKQRLEVLSKIMGKDDFRNFALGLIEGGLIIEANRELSALCDGRYQLKSIETKQGNEFYILDQWNSGMERKVKTLSGGETFLVSLALALALAELTRGQAEIDSFFIDEGFGSLDDDCIEEVLEVLMAIRNRGKQIGIISHIKNLTDRIPINIKLLKSQFGESKIQTNLV